MKQAQFRCIAGSTRYLIVFLATGITASIGCSDKFGSCRAHRSCPETGGSGGDDGGSGEASGGAEIGSGGVAGAAGGSGGSLHQGGASAASSGASPSVGGVSTGGGSTAGGSSGEAQFGGESSSAGNENVEDDDRGTGTLGKPCPLDGAYACSGHAQRGQLVCDSGIWSSNGACATGQYCDTSEANTGFCVAIVESCLGKRGGEAV
jgi:hypothetical protein